MKLHSHYDNLKVSRDAPPEVIRAAYKSLAQKYHPDRNPDPKAARILTMINAAYEVLSDPTRRAEHDRWIALKERQPADEAVRPEAPPPTPRPRPAAAPTREANDSSEVLPMPIAPFVFAACICIPVLAAALIMSLNVARYEPSAPSPPTENTAAKESAPKPGPEVASNELPPGNQNASLAQPAPVQQPPAYVRPATGPFGYPWPRRAAYLTGTAVGATGGQSQVTIDNTRGGHDVHAKLVHTGALGGSYGLRECLIPAGQSFSLENLAPGDYEVRYLQLDDGDAFSTDSMALQEYQTSDGIRYNSVRITLFNVRNGNMRPTPISRGAF